MLTQENQGIFKPKAFFAIKTLPEPTSVRASLQIPKWKDVMQCKYNSLIKNETWDLVPPPMDSKIIRNKWVFKTKLKFDHFLYKYKSRMVAKRFHKLKEYITLRHSIQRLNQQQLDLF